MLQLWSAFILAQDLKGEDQDHGKCKDQDVLDWVTKWLIGLSERQWFGRWCGHNEKKSMDEENNVCASCQERFLWRSPNLQLSLSLLTLPTPGRPSANQCQDPPKSTQQQFEVQTLDVCSTLPVLVSVNSTMYLQEFAVLCSFPPPCRALCWQFSNIYCLLNPP